MSFQIGDMVIFKYKEGTYLTGYSMRAKDMPSLMGVIRGVRGREIAVEWENFTYGHNCGGLCGLNSGYWVDVTYLTRVPNKISLEDMM